MYIIFSPILCLLSTSVELYHFTPLPHYPFQHATSSWG